MSLISDWKNWCRTCGKNNLLNPDCYAKWDALDKDSLEIMQKLILTDSEMIESGNICIDCRKFLKEIVRFSKQCRNITDMYAEINLESDCDLLTVRSRYGLKDDGEDKGELLSLRNPFENEDNLFIYPQELVKLEIKLEDIQENVEPEYMYTNCIIQNEKFPNPNRDLSKVNNKKKTKINSTSTRNRNGKGKRDKMSIENLNNTEGFLCVPFCDDHTVSDNNNITNKNKNTNVLQQKTANVVAKTKKFPLKKRRIKKSIKCPICYLRFYEQFECELHMNTNHSTYAYPFDCSKCPKRFSTAVGLKIHDRVHADGLQILSKAKYKDAFVCDQCGKCCSSSTILSEHISTHSDVYPYQCTKCPQKYKHIYNLRRHQNKAHSGIIFICDICGLRFTTKRVMSAHMIVHSTLKQYKCKYCGKEYKRPTALKLHLICHSGLKPYKCPFCEESFTYGNSCRLHKKAVHQQQLAELEASGKSLPSTNLPKLNYLHIYNQNIIYKLNNNNNNNE